MAGGATEVVVDVACCRLPIASMMGIADDLPVEYETNLPVNIPKGARCVPR